MLDSVDKTKVITEAIEEYLSSLGWNVSREYKIDLTRSSSTFEGKIKEIHGRIDLFAKRNNESLAIEIDRGNKPWSLKKLEYCIKTYGSKAVWIRWKGEVTSAIPDGVIVYDISDGHAERLK